jgi:hypothetical protein
MNTDAVTHFRIACYYYSLGDCGNSIKQLESAISLAPTFGEAYCNLAGLYSSVNRREEAIIAAERAVSIFPNDADCHSNLAVAYHSTSRYDEAIVSAKRALELDPNHAMAHFNLAMLLLLSGDFSWGWEEYIWTWRVPFRITGYPLLERLTTWQGEGFSGKSLLITVDEGFGDSMQIVRYLPLVKSRGGEVTLLVSDPLLELFENLSGVDCVRLSEADIYADLHIPLSGLPRLFFGEAGFKSLPTPYLMAQPKRIDLWKRRLSSPGKLRVGIVWSGDPMHANNKRRSMQIDDFAPLGDIEGVTWFGLQKGIDEELRGCGSLVIDSLGSEIHDFADTAAIIETLDLVISIDTAVVHLAGALGKPVWTLLHFVPDWRWQLDRVDSPWYPTMRLFRQPSDGDWESVISEVATCLRQRSGANA